MATKTVYNHLHMSVITIGQCEMVRHIRILMGCIVVRDVPSRLRACWAKYGAFPFLGTLNTRWIVSTTLALHQCQMAPLSHHHHEVPITILGNDLSKDLKHK